MVGVSYLGGVEMNIPLTPVCFLRRAGEQYPDRTALVCGKERFTFREFGERVGGLAGGPRRFGCPPRRLRGRRHSGSR